ncbi:Panacea domain-containing protein [Helicobacter pylori]
MKALDAAKILINLSLDNQKPITNLKLQKMLYIAQAESDSKLIKEDFQAWDYGPVIPDVYRNFCSMDQPQSLKERKYRII